MALQALWKERKLPLRKTVRLALNVGQVPVTFRQDADGLLYGDMEQPDPQFSSAHDPSAVAPLLGLQSGDIDTSLPIQLVSTGLPYVLVPLKSRDAISKISIDWTRALPWLERVGPDAVYPDSAYRSVILVRIRFQNRGDPTVQPAQFFLQFLNFCMVGFRRHVASQVIQIIQGKTINRSLPGSWHNAQTAR